MLVKNKFYRQTRMPLPINQFGVLFTLLLDKPASITEIGRNLHISKQQMTTIISKLESAGYVRRQEDPKDHRRSIIHLTKKSNALLEQQNAIIEQMFMDGLKHLSKEESASLQQALSIIKTLIEKMPELSAYEK